LVNSVDWSVDNKYIAAEEISRSIPSYYQTIKAKRYPDNKEIAAFDQLEIG